MPTVVFVHGACVRDQAWWWGRMVEPLAAHDLSTVAVDLPSCQMPQGKSAGLADDVAAVTAAIEAAGDGDGVVLCGHSYGGLVITEAGAHAAVEHLVFMTAVVPDEGDTMASMSGPQPAPWMDPGEDGTVGVLVDPVLHYFAWDLDDDTRRGAVARLTRQSARPFTEPPRVIAWREKPSTFVVCTEDRAIPAERQRLAAQRLTNSVDIESGHFPFLTQPKRLAAILADAAR